MRDCRDIEGALSRHQDGESSAEEAARIEAHLAACPACRAEVAALRRLDRAVSDALGGHPFGGALAARISAAAAKARTPSGRVRPAPPSTTISLEDARRRRAAMRPVLFAAAAGLLIAATLVRVWPRDETPVSHSAPVIAQVRSSDGGRVLVMRAGSGDVTSVMPGGQVALRAGDEVMVESRGGVVAFADGTRVHARPDTRIAVRGDDDGAAGVAIIGGPGEVFCEVTKREAGRPAFRVETPAAVVEVLGTRFGVRADDGATTFATVLEGTVRLTSLTGGDTLLVTADERGRVLASAAPRVERVRAREVLAWAVGREPAPAVIRERPPVRTEPPVTPPAAPTLPANPSSDADLPIGPR